jgi:hypothetical protein
MFTSDVCSDAMRVEPACLGGGGRAMFRWIALLLLLINTLCAQNRVSPEMMYHRVWAVVPLIEK